jgi:outer membrane protein OmpA-like peptidoglycan-associated protein/tetratricopeptide (TPR) repeat protein
MKNILIGIIFLFSIHAFAQSEKEAEGNKYYQNYSFDKAIDKYTHVDKLSVNGQRRLAESYRNRDNFKEAEKVYAKFINTPAANVDDYFNYVQVLRANGKYGEVKKWMGKIAKQKPNDLRVKSFMENEENFQHLLADNHTYNIANLDLNSADEDFGTSFYQHKIVFTSSRKGFGPVFRHYNWNRKPFLDIYVADVDSSYQLKNPKYWNKKMNKKWHQGPACFAKHDSMMAYTRNNYAKNTSDVRLQIFFSYLKNGKWTEPEAFYLNNSKYSVGHPCLTKDGNMMFFVSDMSGGYGGTDIYMVKKDSTNKWGKPINLGNKINTEGNEMFPFYEEKNGLLFFSSNGLAGLGGLDVFVAQQTPTGFDDVQNVGVPINSSDDDFAYIIDEKLQHGYFSSNRADGKGGDDIYKFSFAGHFKKEEPTVVADVVPPKKTDSIPIIQPAPIVKDTTPLVVNENKKIILRNIYYDFDKSDILPESDVELDKLVRFLNDNPSLKIELGSHTDSRGSEEYNMRLSEARARSAVDYLVSKGIDANRITAKGYGKTQLINRCADGIPCTETEQRENRRTEITILEYGKAENVKQVKGKQ